MVDAVQRHEVLGVRPLRRDDGLGAHGVTSSRVKFVHFMIALSRRASQARFVANRCDISTQWTTSTGRSLRCSARTPGARSRASACASRCRRPAVKRRVDRLEADGVIRGYTALVDPGRFGWGTHAFVALYCEGRMAAAEVREAVERHPEVEAAYTVAGEASAMLHVRARDTAHLEQALERIRDHPGVTRTQTQIVLSTLFERPFRRGCRR